MVIIFYIVHELNRSKRTLFKKESALKSQSYFYCMYQRKTEAHLARFQGVSCGICNPVKRDYSCRLSYRRLPSKCFMLICNAIKYKNLLIYLAKLFYATEFTTCVKWYIMRINQIMCIWMFSASLALCYDSVFLMNVRITLIILDAFIQHLLIQIY